MRAAVFFQMTHPGVPVIYYGDELGMRGGPTGLPMSMTWDRVNGNAMLAITSGLTHSAAPARFARGHAQNVGSRRGRPVCYLRQTEKGDGAVRAEHVRTGDSPA